MRQKLLIIAALVVSLANQSSLAEEQKQPAETELARLAFGMKPGTWAELKTANYTPELLRVQNSNILGYTDTAVWNPKSQQVLFVGQGHYAAVKFIVYSAASNSWKLMPTPIWWAGDAKTGKGPIAPPTRTTPSTRLAAFCFITRAPCGSSIATTSPG